MLPDAAAPMFMVETSVRARSSASFRRLRRGFDSRLVDGRPGSGNILSRARGCVASAEKGSRGDQDKHGKAEGELLLHDDVLSVLYRGICSDVSGYD
jgi:hypothetical protein